MKKLQCAVIGLGRLGFHHATNLAGRIPAAELVAVSDISQVSLDLFTAGVPNVKTYLDYHELLNDKEIDAVIVASSTSMHGIIVKDAVYAKKAVFCEKPLSLDLDEAEEIQKLVKKENAFVQLGFMRRFDSGYVVAKKKIESEKIGKPVSILAISRDPSCPPIEFAKTSGGLVMDMSIHDIDLCRWFFGCEAVEAYAKGGVIRYPELGEIGDIDHANISLTFENGEMALLETSRNSTYGYDVRTEVVCERGGVFVGRLEDAPAVILTPEEMGVTTLPGFLDRFEQAYFNEMKVFVKDVLEGNPVSVGVDDGVAAMIITKAIQKSLNTNKAVRIKEVMHEAI